MKLSELTYIELELLLKRFENFRYTDMSGLGYDLSAELQDKIPDLVVGIKFQINNKIKELLENEI